MNVTFTLAKPELDGEFLAAAAAAGLQGLKGHRAIGGMRASIYNAMPLEGVERLIAFMRDFERRHAEDAAWQGKIDHRQTGSANADQASATPGGQAAAAGCARGARRGT